MRCFGQVNKERMVVEVVLTNGWLRRDVRNAAVRVARERVKEAEQRVRQANDEASEASTALKAAKRRLREAQRRE
jgi:cellobiose-specific phosphotransferase system component IIA